MAATAPSATKYKFKRAIHHLTVTGASEGANTSNPDKLNLDFSTNSLVFDTTNLGEFQEKTVTIQNNSANPTTVSQIITSGSGFSTTSNCAGTLGVGQTCFATVKFTPTEVGNAVGSLSIAQSFTQSAIIALNGTGALGPQPNMVVVGFYRDLGWGYVGQSASLSFLMQNTGSGTAQGVYIEVPNSDFHLTENTCGVPEAPAAVLPGQYCQVSYEYMPKQPIVFTGQVKGKFLKNGQLTTIFDNTITATFY